MENKKLARPGTRSSQLAAYSILDMIAKYLDENFEKADRPNLRRLAKHVLAKYVK